MNQPTKKSTRGANFEKGATSTGGNQGGDKGGVVKG
jgi:hypothetical protein